MSTLSTVVIIYVAVINAFTFLLFGFDKWMARAHSWRTPEIVLFTLAAVGGSVGALVGTSFFRHKTKKISFQFLLWLIVLIQATAIFATTYLRQS